MFVASAGGVASLPANRKKIAPAAVAAHAGQPICRKYSTA
jgi:hypothetical protein